MFIRNTTLIALLGLLIIQSCSKKELPTPPLPPPVVYHHDGEVSKMLFNRPDGVNIVFIGDAFTKEDLKENGRYDALVKEITNFLFSVEPFKQYKNYFNIYQVYAESQVSGAADTYTPHRTKFDAYFGTVNDRYLLPGNYDLCYEYAAKAVPTNQIALLVMLVNDERYAGTGGSIATISSNKLARFTLVHEAGHSFAGLADEYVEEAIADNYPMNVLPYLPNVDITSDPTKIKWAKLLEYKNYPPQLGAFEGGYYRGHGIYRPEETSIMRDFSVMSFNAPSREAIVRMIYARMNIPFDLELFVKDDVKNIKPIPATATLQIPPLRHDFIEMKENALKLHQLRQQSIRIK
jgi:hypothetical protein